MATVAHELSFEQKLDQLARVAIEVGLGLARGQELVMTAPLDAVPLARRITEHAYRAGASLVTTLYSDDEALLARFRYAPDEAFDKAAAWLYDGMGAAYRSGAARLAITGASPQLLSGQDPDKVGRANQAVSRAYRPALELITRHEINWKAHDAGLQRRAAFMNEKRYAALQYRGPGTDFRLGLSDDHLWMGGGTTAGNGLYCIPNMPTEEIFTTPHKDRADGTVRATKPLSYQGTMIEGIEVRFEAGRIVQAHATRGLEILQKLISTDDGARRLGEVALVPHASPIASSGMLFYNTLFDENAASHIALGQAYTSCLKNGDKLTPEELAARGANSSLIHVDWMIGSSDLDIDGITASGTAEPVMRNGNWV
jgi:aminopeptidase